jgi:hypothetical protein
MDSIGDYLYIIIFVVIIVVNILKRLKKQQPVATSDYSGNYSESESRENNKEEEDDFWKSLSSSPQQPAVQVQQVQNIQQIQNKRKDVETILPKNESKKKSTGFLDDKEENKDTVSVAFNDRDDARRAFIYSEIWNRKY